MSVTYRHSTDNTLDYIYSECADVMFVAGDYSAITSGLPVVESTGPF